MTLFLNPETPKRVRKSLLELGVGTADDLLRYLPRSYKDYSKQRKISELIPDEDASVCVTITDSKARFNPVTKRSHAEAIGLDDSGMIKLMWFNQGYIAKQLIVGKKYFFAGKVTRFGRRFQMTNPVFEEVTEETVHTGRIIPVYKTIKGLSQKALRQVVHEHLGLCRELTERLPSELLQEEGFLDVSGALSEIHFPTSSQALELAKKRFMFETLLTEQLAATLHKNSLDTQKAQSVRADIELVKKFLKKLPFTPTLGQKASAWAILQDMEKARPMNRLLQGDVGSGKTLVATIALLVSASQAKLCAFLCPTEILAYQHFQNLQGMLKGFRSIKIGLLTNTYALYNKETLKKKTLLERVSADQHIILIGTHALFMQPEPLPTPALVVIDEQHRFGVRQRAKLSKATEANDHKPHLLSMTATPIPRSLALTIYSDLEVSLLTEKPGGRKEIITRTCVEKERDKVNLHILNELRAGRQVFWVSPHLEESDEQEISSAKTEFEKLKKGMFGKFKIGLLYGPMKGEEKERVMLEMAEKKLDILVATSVIEIGIDVPNASVMVIESAERFGLAELHQLRGRVGRGEAQSYCFLFATGDKVSRRLEYFASENNGFKLAEYDMKTRGFGNLFGDEQSGQHVRFGDFVSLDLLKHTKKWADRIVSEESLRRQSSELLSAARRMMKDIHLE